MTISLEALAEHHRQFKDLKDHMWEDHELRDMPPQSMAVIGGQEVMIPTHLISEAQILFGSYARHYYRGAPSGARAKMEEMLQSFDSVSAASNLALGLEEVTSAFEGPIDIIMMVTDGHSRLHQSMESAAAEVAGSMKSDFESNPDSDVREVLTTYAIEPDLVGGTHVSAIYQDYWLDEGGKFGWGNELFLTDEQGEPVTGGLIEAARAAIEGSRKGGA